jgi:UPF0716 protein FxsA
MPFILILAAFIGVPILEIAVFIQAGDLFGLWPTLGVVILTAIVGATLLRAQGLATLERARYSLDRGEIPVEEVFTGLCLLVAGALLLTPGFVTDSLGLLLFVPPVRHVIGHLVLTRLARGRGTRARVNGEEVVAPRRERGDVDRDAVDVDYTEVDPPRKGP